MSANRRSGTRSLAVLSLLVAVAMLLSYIEHLLPTPIPIPGVKLGLANIATVFALYTLGRRYAIVVSVVRVSLAALLFGNVVGLLYAASGAAFALIGMCLLKGCPFFSPVGVSVAGGVLHNAGQIIAAAAVMQTSKLIAAYLPILIASGTLAGVLIGVAAGLLVQRIGDRI